MKALGASLIVLGLAFLFSGLIFVLPLPRRKRSRPKESFEESQERTEYYLKQMRKERDER
jgi:thioesterase domain-containing protein